MTFNTRTIPQNDIEIENVKANKQNQLEAIKCKNIYTKACVNNLYIVLRAGYMMLLK